MNRRQLVLWVATAGAATGCSVAPKTPLAAVYDLGPPPPAWSAMAADHARADAGAGRTSAASVALGPRRALLRVFDIIAPTWLNGTGMAYRLDHVDRYRREIYRDSRWAAPPAAMLSLRVRQRLAAVPPADGPANPEPRTLQISLDEFTQIFTSDSDSKAIVQIRARLGEPGAARLAVERPFSAERPAPSADAQGGVRALALATDALVEQIVAWATAG